VSPSTDDKPVDVTRSPFLADERAGEADCAVRLSYS
jgi:hypothetical protein